MLGKCTTCGYELPDPPGRKYLVVFGLPWGGIRVEIGCDHHRVDITGALAFFSGQECFLHWLYNMWGPSVAGCAHQEQVQ